MENCEKLSRRSFFELTGGILAGGAGVLALSRSGFGADAQTRPRRPNIIIILADDLGYGDIGCYGHKEIKTPHLDALAAAGVRFTDFHSSGAVCSPTRAGLMTGRYQQRAGVPGVITAKGHRDKGLAVDEITFSRQLKDAGYATAIFGKWHLGYQPRFNPTKHGFDRFRGYVSGNVDYISHVDQTGVADWWDGATKITEEGYVTHLITKHSVRFIEENKDSAFCLYVAHESPHYPYQGPRDKPDRRPGGKNFQTQGSRRDREAAYKEMIEILDDGVGEIVATVKRLGLDRDTFIFFFSDNGGTGPGNNGPLRGKKGSVWEGGHRVPAIACWPGTIPAGRETGELTISLDLFPTMTALGGARVPNGHKLDGVNLLPLLTESRGLGERTLFWGHGGQRAMRQGAWKLVRGAPGQKRLALFNLATDLAEQSDLAAEHPQRLRAMAAALAAWEREVMPNGVWWNDKERAK